MATRRRVRRAGEVYVSTSVRLTTRGRERLRALAGAEGKSLSATVEALIDEAAERKAKSLMRDEEQFNAAVLKALA